MGRNALLITVLLLCFAAVLSAQVEINNLATESNPFLCQPGVSYKTPGKGASINYTFNPDFKMRAPDAENPERVQNNQRFGANLKIPLINCRKAKLMLGFKYNMERYDFSDIEPGNGPLFKHLNDVTLKKTEVAAYFIAPINHKYYTSVRLSAGYQGDYDGFVSLNDRYAVYRAAGLLGIKKNENLEYGVGILFSKNARRASVYPFGFINKTFNEHWGIESAIPVNFRVRYNVDRENIILTGVEYSSQNYTLNFSETRVPNAFPTNAVHYYRRASLQLATSYYRQVSDWTWLEFKFGYAFNMNSETRDVADQINHDLNPTGSMFGLVSFFISPPKRFLK